MEEGNNPPATDMEVPLHERWPQLREWIHAAQAKGQLPSRGVSVRVRELEFQSRPLYKEGNTIHYLARKLNPVVQLRDRWNPDPQRCRDILRHLDLDIPAGSMTLVIGSPSSGKVRAIHGHRSCENSTISPRGGWTVGSLRCARSWLIRMWEEEYEGN